MKPRTAAAALCVLLSGCSSTTRTTPDAASVPNDFTTGQPSPSPSPSPVACPDRPTTLQWPDGIPGDLPKPPTAVRSQVMTRSQGVTLVRFSTTRGLRESILYVVKALPAAGFTVGRGDAEASEADAPFIKAGQQGIMRMVSVSPCRTDWLVAVAASKPVGGGTPLLPTRPSASPLPFG